MTTELPPGEHKARVTGIKVDDNKLTIELETSAGKVEYAMHTQKDVRINAVLEWKHFNFHTEAIIGDFDGGDGVRFTLQHLPTCYRRGPYKLLVEVAPGENHEKWGCFDDADQPMRYYHFELNAFEEAQQIAWVLAADREKRS